MLSGGQKQRISFARSMLENCELLILDNIMSALDYETENILLQSIKKKEYSSSILLISHRARYYRMPIIFWFWNRKNCRKRNF